MNNQTIRVIGLLFLISCLLITPTLAQPGWVKKSAKSVFTVKTFSADGSLIGSSNGFYVGTKGEAISNFAPFKGASRAVIIDTDGKEWPVAGIMGANDMYDIVKFRVSANKTQPLPVAAGIAPEGSTVWLLPYRAGKEIPAGTVRKAETFASEYAYYTVAMKTTDTQVSCPLLNENGEVIGLIQPSASDADTLSYAISARYADSLKISALSLNDPNLKATAIRKELPASLNDANMLMFMASNSTDSATYAGLVEDFIQTFPDAPDGYVYRAQMAAAATDFSSADRDMQQALKVAKEKDDVLFNFARMIYQKNVFQSNVPYESWTLDKALGYIQEANKRNFQPAYRQTEANILFAQKRYDEAYEIFVQLTDSEMDKAEMWYAASRCKEMLKDTTAMLALLDSTMQSFSKPYLKQAAPYLMARANARMDTGKYRDAVFDLNDYEQLMAAQVTARFYYIRHQAEVEGRLFQQALNDISKAIQMEPKETLYYAEKASLQIRVGQYDEALKTAEECIAIDPNGSDGYLFKGLAQCLSGKKADGIKNLQKAKELGDPQAEGLIQKYQ